MNKINPAPQSSIPALRAKDLSLYYGSQKALESVSMDIYQGHITAIIGPSGCGKSTFIKSLNRVSELESSNVKVEGQVEFYGQNIYASRVNLNRFGSKSAWYFKSRIRFQ